MNGYVMVLFVHKKGGGAHCGEKCSVVWCDVDHTLTGNYCPFYRVQPLTTCVYLFIGQRGISRRKGKRGAGTKQSFQDRVLYQESLKVNQDLSSFYIIFRLIQMSLCAFGIHKQKIVVYLNYKES